MSMENIFEVAIREKYRFPFKGQISTEDLWDLSLENLDFIFKVMNAQVKQAKEESLLSTKSKQDETLSNQISIIRYIVSVKQKEKEDRMLEKEKFERKKELLAILNSKEKEADANKSADEIRAMIAELGV